MLRHIVLATTPLVRATWTDKRVLQQYRHQHMMEGHTGFRWLKGVADVAPILLEPPQRIAALALVCMLALRVRNDIQFTLRRQLAANEANGEVLGQVHGLVERCTTVLEMLSVPVDVFTTVREKSLATGPPTPGLWHRGAVSPAAPTPAPLPAPRPAAPPPAR